MPSARKLYPEFTGEGDTDDYQPIIDAIGTPIVQYEIGQYDGDTLILFRNANHQYGYLTIGWGSCSGCDALQGCESYDDLQALIDEIEAGVRWFDSAGDALHFINNHDWAGEYFGGDPDTAKFVAECQSILSQES
jgi:hypothetical protein